MGENEYYVPWEIMNIMPWEIKNIMSLGYYEMSRMREIMNILREIIINLPIQRKIMKKLFLCVNITSFKILKTYPLRPKGMYSSLKI